MNAEEREAHVRAIARTCRGGLPPKIREKVNSLLDEGKDVAARTLDRASRPNCGYDFNETILAGDLDGEVHEYECPDCGVKGIYRAPLFDEEAEEE